MSKNGIGEKIRLLRVLARKSQAEIAREAGCTQPLISMIELEKVLPGKQLCERLAKSFDVPIEMFLSEVAD